MRQISNGIFGDSGLPLFESGLDGGARTQRAQDLKRGDSAASQFGRDVLGDAGEAEHDDVQALAPSHRLFQVGPGVMAQSEIQVPARHRFFQSVVVAGELIANSGPDEVGAVRIKPFFDQEIDVAEIDKAEIDRDFLAVRKLWAKVAHIVHRHCRHP